LINTKNIKDSSLIDIIANDLSLRNIILREIVLNQILLKLPDGSDLNYDAIQKFVEYKDKTLNLKGSINCKNLNIISSLLFELNEDLVNDINSNSNNTLRKRELIKSVLVKTITIDNNIDTLKLINNIKSIWNLGLNGNVKNLHIYFIINGKLKNSESIFNLDNVYECKNYNKIHVHYLSSNYFFEPQFLSSFYKKATLEIARKYSVSVEELSGYRRETETKMNIFIFNGFE
jgi:hypothetical protein